MLWPESQATIASSASRSPKSRASRSGVSRPRAASAERSSKLHPFALAPLRELEERRGRACALARGDERLQRLARVADEARPPPETAGRCAWHRGRSARRAPARASGSTRRTETSSRRSAACRIPRRLPATARVPSKPMPPVVSGWSSGTTALPSSALTIGAPSSSRQLEQFVARAERALAREDRDALAAVQDLERARDALLVGHALRRRSCANDT